MKNSRWIKWGILVLAMVLCIPGLALAQGNGGNGGNGGNNGGFNSFTMNNPEPVLIYTVWGGSVAGDTASTLVVYNNGLAIWSQSDASGTGNNGCTGNSVQTVQITSQDIQDLLLQLRRAGAFRQTANNRGSDSGDTTLTTITVFTNPSRGRNGASLAQTFSFSGDASSIGGSRGQVNNIFTNFLNTNFGDSGSGGSGGGSGQ
jgi:hypothetical protein